MQAGNSNYETPVDLPGSIPVFPLSGALLLPGGQMPLNIFEPRYLEMVDSAMAGDRIIGMVQPAEKPMKCGNVVADLCTIGCAGRIISFQETGDGRYSITLAGISRFAILKELSATTQFRQCLVDWNPFEQDLIEDATGDDVNRDILLKTMHDYLEANNMHADWESIDRVPTETLVNALCMMSPYGPAEKQALLEAESLQARAETLIAITEFSLASEGNDDSSPTLQ